MASHHPVPLKRREAVSYGQAVPRHRHGTGLVRKTWDVRAGSSVCTQIAEALTQFSGKGDALFFGQKGTDFDDPWAAL